MLPDRSPSPYQRAQRQQQARWKQTAADLSQLARAPGRWEEASVNYILPAASAIENLFPPIRDELLAYFRREVIAWHDEDAEGYGPRPANTPSPHLLDSQVCALNFW